MKPTLRERRKKKRFSTSNEHNCCEFSFAFSLPSSPSLSLPLFKIQQQAVLHHHFCSEQSRTKQSSSISSSISSSSVAVVESVYIPIPKAKGQRAKLSITFQWEVIVGSSYALGTSACSHSFQTIGVYTSTTWVGTEKGSRTTNRYLLRQDGFGLQVYNPIAWAKSLLLCHHHLLYPFSTTLVYKIEDLYYFTSVVVLLTCIFIISLSRICIGKDSARARGRLVFVVSLIHLQS